MKKTHFPLFFVTLCLTVGFASGFAVPASAQQALPQYVAVVDVAQLIKEHPEFTAKQQALQAVVQAEETKFRARQQELADQEKKLAASPHKAGTPEHQALLDKIQNDYADFDKEARLMQRKFAIENSKIMYETYRDIKNVIGQFAKTRGIAQVTDFRQFEVNPADPQTVAEDMDQKLVWFDPMLNVTEHVINELYTSKGLTRPAKTATPAGATPVASPVR